MVCTFDHPSKAELRRRDMAGLQKYGAAAASAGAEKAAEAERRKKLADERIAQRQEEKRRKAKEEEEARQAHLCCTNCVCSACSVCLVAGLFFVHFYCRARHCSRFSFTHM